MSCEHCGVPVYQYEGKWLHAIKGDYDHPPTPEGSLPKPRRKPVTAAKEALYWCRKLYPWRVRHPLFPGTWALRNPKVAV